MAPKKPRARRTRGAGSVYRTKDGSWFAQTRIDGRIVRRRAADEQAAKKKLDALQELKVKRVDVVSGAQDVATWLQACLAEKVRLKHPKARTIEEERGLIERYILPVIGGLALLDARPTHLQKVVDATYDGIKADGRYDGARTTHAVAAILQRVFSLAAARRLIPDDPYAGIMLPTYRAAAIEAIEDAALQRVLGLVKGDRMEGLWLVYAFLGLRRGEGLGLRWMAYDRQAQTLKVDQQVQVVQGQLVFATPKTDQSVRILPLPRRLAAFLDLQWATQQRERQGGAWTEHGLIFPAHDGAPIWPSVWGEHFRRIRARAGLPATVKPHHLRHTLATLLDECGATEALKSSILGHTDKTQTQHYTHGRIDAMRRVLQAVEDRVLGAVEARERSG